MKSIHDPADVGAEYRPVPFWSWNDRLDAAELERQIALMAEAGMGGFFMHARGGLATEYMSGDWMRAVRTAIEAGRARGLAPWAYDENGWPSGFAGGTVNGLGARYQQKYLRFGKRSDAAVSEAADRAEQEGRFLGSWTVESEECCAWYELNPYYVDTLDAAVTAAFIEKTHERYTEFLPASGRQALEGFFTDEPQISRNGLPWSPALREEYRSVYGEDLIDRIPELFLKTGEWARTRRRFFRTAAVLHSRNFLRPIREWLETRGLKLTGHQVCEETFEAQLTTNGAVMPHYREYSIPGMDWLGRHIDPITTPVQVASAAAQTGKDMILSETFALCGWHVSFSELRWIYEWQMVHGVTLLCQHLEAYSLRGIRKRDYPPSLFFQQPWWPEYRRFVDPISRIGRLLADGRRAERVLLIHGQSGAWAFWNDPSELEAAFSAFADLSYRLDEAWIGFHYGDEIIIEDIGRTEASGTDRPRLTVGKMSYDAVALPPVFDLSPAVASLLLEFARAGGIIIAVQPENCPLPREDGAPSERTRELFDILQKAKTVVRTPEEAAELLLPFAAARAPGGRANTDAFAGGTAGEGRLLCTIRDFDDFTGAPARLYYIVNTDRERDLTLDADFQSGAARVERFDPDTGTLTPFPAECSPGSFRACAVIPAMGSLLLIAYPAGSTSRGTGEAPVHTREAVERSDRTPILSSGPWKIVSADLNALPLDTCDIFFDGELVAQNESITVVQHRLMTLGRPVDLELRFRFSIDAACLEKHRESFRLAAETPERFTFTLNGTPLAGSPDGAWYRDPAFRVLDAAEALTAGENLLVQRCRFEQPQEVYESYRRSFEFESEKNKFSFDLEIEALYLLGDFAVESAAGSPEELPKNALRFRGPFTLVAPRDNAESCDPVLSGYPFLAGSVRFAKTVSIDRPEGLGFRFDRLTASVAKLFVNGQEVKTFLWKPFEAALDAYLVAGENTIEVEVTGSLRNLLGPHHLAEGESWFVGPFSFYKEPGLFGRTWTGDALPWDDGYCVMRSGVEGIVIR